MPAKNVPAKKKKTTPTRKKGNKATVKFSPPPPIAADEQPSASDIERFNRRFYDSDSLELL